MEYGYRDWRFMKKLLIDNNLEHAAQLAYGTGVSEKFFVARAMLAYKRTEEKVADLKALMAEAVEAVVAEAEAHEAEAQAANDTKDPIEPPKDPDPAGGE